MIIKLQDFANERGMKISERTRVDEVKPGEPIIKFDRFVGTAGIPIRDGQGNVVDLQSVDFPIIAENIAEAFSKFEQSIREYMAKMKAKASQQIVIPPPGVNLPPAPDANANKKSGLIIP
jgi:hypothetical protein